MFKIFANIAEWVAKHSVKWSLAGAGLSIISFVVTKQAIEAAITKLLTDAQASLTTDVISLMGLAGIDILISTIVSVGIFILSLKASNLTIRKGTTNG